MGPATSRWPGREARITKLYITGSQNASSEKVLGAPRYCMENAQENPSQQCHTLFIDVNLFIRDTGSQTAQLLF